MLALSVSPALAQNNNNGNKDKQDEQTNTRFWEAKLPGGEYMVALSRISSISKHTYMVGNLEITEVVVDTTGNSLVRFYAANTAGGEANILKNAQDRLRDLGREKGAQAGVQGAPVIKNYPDTTHAKTVEYNLDTESAVNALYNSVKKSWERNRGGRFTIK